MSVAHFILFAFIAALVFGFRVARKADRLNQFSIVVGCLAVIGFSIPLLITVLTGNKSNFLELVIGLIILLVLIPIVWKLFSILQEQKSKK